jgi:hypothetical protein
MGSARRHTPAGLPYGQEQLGDKDKTDVENLSATALLFTSNHLLSLLMSMHQTLRLELLVEVGGRPIVATPYFSWFAIREKDDYPCL